MGPGQKKVALPWLSDVGYWNNGMLEDWVWRNEICFYMDGTDQKIKSDHHPFLIPNIPFFHHSTIPLVI